MLFKIDTMCHGKKRRPELVLLDIWMPDCDGITLLKEWVNEKSNTKI